MNTIPIPIFDGDLYFSGHFHFFFFFSCVCDVVISCLVFIGQSNPPCCKTQLSAHKNMLYVRVGLWCRVTSELCVVKSDVL